MALSLNQISEQNQKKVSSEAKNLVEKKTIRPWENNESSSNIYAGQLAVKRAQEIKSKNNFLVDELRVEANPRNIQNIEDLIRAKELEFENLEKLDMSHRKIKTDTGLLRKLKNLIF